MGMNDNYFYRIFDTKHGMYCTQGSDGFPKHEKNGSWSFKAYKSFRQAELTVRHLVTRYSWQKPEDPNRYEIRRFRFERDELE